MVIENKSQFMYARRNWFTAGKHCSAFCFGWNVQYCLDTIYRFIGSCRGSEARQ